jgi:haloalkane dehalogenase
MIDLGRRKFLLTTAVIPAAALFLDGCSEVSTVARSAWRDHKRYQDVYGQRMAYYEAGSGRPIVFLHGNPTSSYLWRNIIPYVQHMGRCVAPDLIGMGDSAKLPNSGPGVYTYKTHRRYLFGLLREIGADRDIALVLHDWGSALGFDFASHNPSAIRGLAYMEAMLIPPFAKWRPNMGSGPHRGELHAAYLTPRGEHLILDENTYIEHGLIGSMGGYLSEEDKAEYRRPFLKPGESRRPMLEWPRQGQLEETFNIKKVYSAWLLRSTQIPKLFIHAVPGVLFSVKPLLDFALSLPNQKVVTVSGHHFVQEESPDAVGRALAAWLAGLG